MEVCSTGAIQQSIPKSSQNNLTGNTLIRVDARAPVHPGVILEFEKPEVGEDGDTPHYVKIHLPCDTYRFWEDNLRAIAMVLEGLRMIDRHGDQPHNMRMPNAP